MTDTTDEENGLIKLVRDQVRRGTSYFDIERLFGIPAARAEQMMSDYYKAKAKGGNLDEARFLQLERFEMMIGPMMDRVELGDVKAAEALIKTLTAINETLGLVKEQKSIEITLITQQQGDAVYKMIEFMGNQMLAMLQQLIPDQELLGEIEDQWDQKMIESLDKAREAKVIEDAVLVS